MSWSPDGRGEPELGPLEVAWESFVRLGRDPNVVVDVAGLEVRRSNEPSRIDISRKKRKVELYA